MEGLLAELYKQYEIDANTLLMYKVNWRNLTKTQLANAYCDADESGDNKLRDHYFSALMCKYSYMTTVFYQRRNSVLMRLAIEDFHGWVAESLMKGLKYRRWRDPEFKHLYNNPNGAEIVFNRCFFSTEKRYYKYYNQDCRKINYISYCTLDDIIPGTNEDSDNLYEIDNIVDPDAEFDVYDSGRDVVQYYLNKGQILQALIVDGIGYQDTFKDEKIIKTEIDCEGNEFNTERVNSTFNSRKLVKHLNNLDDVFVKYFIDNYNVNKSILTDCINKTVKLRNTKLYTVIDNTLTDLRTNKEIREMLNM